MPVSLTTLHAHENLTVLEAPTVEACKQVSDTVTTVLDANQGPSTSQLILAGECLYYPTILSAYRPHLSRTSKRIEIVYVDADCDLYAYAAKLVRKYCWNDTNAPDGA